MAIKFYVSGDVCYWDGEGFPKGILKFKFENSDTNVRIWGHKQTTKTSPLYNDVITGLTDSGGTPYANKAALEAVLPDFFKAGVYDANNTFTPAIKFDAYEKYFSQYVQSGALAISLDSNSFGDPCYIYVTILTDGNNITFPSSWKEIQNEYLNDVGYYGLIIFYDDDFYQYKIYNIGTPAASSVTISYFEMANDNSYIDVTFSAGVYGADDGSTPAAASDFTITNFSAGGITASSISSATKTTGAALTGGETTIRCNLSNTGTADGTATFEIQPASGLSLFDSGGAAIAGTETTTTIYLIKDVTPAALTFQPANLTFLTESSGIYTATNATSWTNKGLADDTLTASGYIVSDIIAAATDISLLGFNLSNSNDGINDQEEAIFTNGTEIYYKTLASNVDTGLTPADNSKIRLRRSTNKVIAEYSTGGNKFRKIYTSARTDASTYYIQIFARSTGETVSNPKIGQ
jgi:hypothetical protein